MRGSCEPAPEVIPISKRANNKRLRGSGVSYLNSTRNVRHVLDSTPKEKYRRNFPSDLQLDWSTGQVSLLPSTFRVSRTSVTGRRKKKKKPAESSGHRILSLLNKKIKGILRKVKDFL